ncbi:hypothetical protein NQ317_016382 [Molorchus minor]|uniref:Uncharacterized protein n=1 Tax=Molorchus minor TaxID=1323400 RepID=A0ABQ9JJ33_9CUCU|nr:hypothetical protein NQ317_016382 [Molorchus minor]
MVVVPKELRNTAQNKFAISNISLNRSVYMYKEYCITSFANHKLRLDPKRLFLLMSPPKHAIISALKGSKSDTAAEPTVKRERWNEFIGMWCSTKSSSNDRDNIYSAAWGLSAEFSSSRKR